MEFHVIARNFSRKIRPCLPIRLSRLFNQHVHVYFGRHVHLQGLVQELVGGRSTRYLMQISTQSLGCLSYSSGIVWRGSSVSQDWTSPSIFALDYTDRYPQPQFPTANDWAYVIHIVPALSSLAGAYVSQILLNFLLSHDYLALFAPFGATFKAIGDVKITIKSNLSR